MSKQLVKEQLKALEELEASGRVRGPRKNKRKQSLSTDVSKIEQIRNNMAKEKQAAQDRNLKLMAVLDSKKKETRKDGTKKKNAVNYIKKIEKHHNRDHERLYGQKEKEKKGKKRARKPIVAEERDDFDVSSESSAEEEPQSKKQKTSESTASTEVDMAAFEKMAAAMMKGGGF